MKATKRIAVALDLSKTDEHILNYTEYFADLIQAEKLLTVHVVPKLFLAESFVGEFPILKPGAPPFEKIQRHLEKTLEDRLSDRTLDCSSRVMEGRPYRELLKLVEESHTDLLVMGKKKQSSGSGITAKRTARHTKCDLLFVPEECQVRISKILVCVDFSQDSAQALNRALKLSRRLQLDDLVQCLYVIDEASFDWNQGLENVRLDPSELPEPIAQDFEQFKQATDIDDTKAKYTFIKTWEPNISKSIKAFSKENGADLIVMGAQGHNRMERFLFGSVTEAMVDSYFPTPIYVVR